MLIYQLTRYSRPGETSAFISKRAGEMLLSPGPPRATQNDATALDRRMRNANSDGLTKITDQVPIIVGGERKRAGE
jgi:hypothetical protein